MTTRRRSRRRSRAARWALSSRCPRTCGTPLGHGIGFGIVVISRAAADRRAELLSAVRAPRPAAPVGPLFGSLNDPLYSFDSRRTRFVDDERLELLFERGRLGEQGRRRVEIARAARLGLGLKAKNLVEGRGNHGDARFTRSARGLKSLRRGPRRAATASERSSCSRSRGLVFKACAQKEGPQERHEAPRRRDCQHPIVCKIHINRRRKLHPSRRPPSSEEWGPLHCVRQEPSFDGLCPVDLCVRDISRNRKRRWPKGQV